MATQNLRPETLSANLTIKDIRHAARSLRRLNEIDGAPVLSADDRAEIRQAKSLCWAVVAGTTEALVSLMDAIAGDPDFELDGDELDGNGSEDDFMRHGPEGPGCPIADPDSAVDDRPCDAEEGV